MAEDKLDGAGTSSVCSHTGPQPNLRSVVSLGDSVGEKGCQVRTLPAHGARLHCPPRCSRQRASEAAYTGHVLKGERRP